MVHEAARNFTNVRQSHIDNQCCLRICKTVPIKFNAAIGTAMTGEIANAFGELPMGQGEFEARRTPLSGCDARHDFKSYSRGGKRQGFLAAAPEEKRITAFEADNGSPRFGEPDQSFVYFLLRNGMMVRLLADIDFRGAPWNEIEDGVGDEPVINDNVRLLKKPARFYGHKLWVAGARTDKKNMPFFHRVNP